MRAWGIALALCLTGLGLGASECSAFTPREHEDLLEENLAAIAEFLGGSYDSTTLILPSRDGGRLELVFVEDSPGFGASSALDLDESDFGRQHPLGATVLSELRELRAEDLENFLDQDSGHAPGGNISARFLSHHWRALRRAREAEGEAQLRDALLAEAQALSHLMDAFSSGQFFSPGRDIFSWMHGTNDRVRRDSFRFLGAYVMDSRGEVWQCFGDGLLMWHPKSRQMVSQAVAVALREFFAAYYGSAAPAALNEWLSAEAGTRDPSAWVQDWLRPSAGARYYEELAMPSLLHLPMAIGATWSERDATRVEHGIAARRHWPQWKDAGGHDPGLDARLMDFLPESGELPPWLRFPRLEHRTPEELLLEDPEVASVRFVQQREIPPTFQGGLLLLGAGRNLRGDDSAWLFSGGLGWGIADQLLPLRRLLVIQRMSVELRGYWDPDSSDAYGVLALSSQLDSGGVPGALHLELGIADGWSGRYTNWGVHLGIGLASHSVKLPGLYAGGMFRVRYSLGYMGEAVHSILFDFLVH